MSLGEDLPKDRRIRPSRRSPRVNSQVPVTIEWSGGPGPLHFEAGYTRVVNHFGCLLVSPTEIGVKQRLRLTNLATRRLADGVVVWKGAQRPEGWELGVELAKADQDFWGINI